MSDSDAPTEGIIFSFGEWVRLRRKALRLSRQEIADAVASSAVLIGKIETDERRPSAPIAERLAHALHIALPDIINFVRVARAQYPVSRLHPPDHGIAAPTRVISTTTLRIDGNLPVDASSFIGRSRELAEVRSLLQQPDVRLLTLTGTGGSGKTRLALKAARALQPHPCDGIWFIDLATITEPAQVPAAILQALGFAADPHITPRETLLTWVRSREILLLIDNFEHLLAAASLVSDMLRTAPQLQVLVTSRIALRLQ